MTPEDPIELPADSAHSTEVQASAARLILLLRDDFPEVIPFSSANDSTEGRNLIAWLNQLILNSDGCFSPPSQSVGHFQALVDCISLIYEQGESPFNNAEMRKVVLQQMVTLLTTASNHFCRNQFLSKDGRVEEVTASTGETLLLLTLATLGRSSERVVAGYAALREQMGDAHPPSAEQSQSDCVDRLRTLFSYLQSLEQGICTAGRQHGLLFLLNQVYPVQTAEGVSPLVLIEDLTSFLLAEREAYLTIAFKHKFANELFPMTYVWLLYEYGLHTNNLVKKAVGCQPHNLLQWLNSMGRPIREYLEKKCRDFGLRNTEQKITMCTHHEYLLYLRVPGDVHPDVLCLRSILSLAEPTTTSVDANSCEAARNRALCELRIEILQLSSSQLPTELPARLRTRIEVFLAANRLAANRLYKTLNRYRGLDHFMCLEAKTLYESINQGRKVLSQTFATLELSNLEELKAVWTEWREQESALKEMYRKVDFVINFFAILSQDTEATFSHLKQLQLEDSNNSLLLTDDVIDAWLAKLNQAVSTNKTVDTSPYEANRFLLHPLLLAINGHMKWSKSFKGALNTLLDWLLKPAPTNGGRFVDLEGAFRSSYPLQFLLNLRCALLVEEIECCRKVIKDFFQSKNVFTSSFLYELLIHRNGNDARHVILAAVKDQLEEIIQDGGELADLLCLRSLEEAWRRDIWMAVKDRLREIIQNGDQLIRLLLLIDLEEAWRRDIWVAVKDRLREIIQNGDQLVNLLRLIDPEKAWRGDIWVAVKDRLGEIIQNGYELADLLRLRDLEKAWRGDIWMAVKKDRLSGIIQNGDQLISLLHLRDLEEAWRKDIWVAVKDRLREIIQNGYQLADLLKLEGLEEAWRRDIWMAVKDRLREIIQNGYQLADLLKLEGLEEAWRRDIWMAVKDRLGEIIQNRDELACLLNLPVLEGDHRTQILDAVGGQLSKLFQNRFQLDNLLKLKGLKEDDRTRILNAVHNEQTPHDAKGSESELRVEGPRVG